jgi:RecA-family ATPase
MKDSNSSKQSKPPARQILKAAPTTQETKPSPPIFDGKGYTGDWLADQHFPELQWAVQDIIPEGLTMLAGPPKAGKSWLSLGIALSVAQGDLALNAIPTRQKKVLILALEDSQRRMQTRCRSILNDNTIPQNLHVYHRVVPDRLISDMKKWVYDNYDPSNPPLVIVDTLGKAVPSNTSNETQYQKDYHTGSELKSVADDYPGTSVLVVHHTRKQESVDFIDSVSGSQGLSGSFDGVIILNRPRNEDEGTLSITGRDVEENELAIRKGSSGNWELIGDDLNASAHHAHQSKTETGLSSNMREVLAFVKSQDQVTAAEVTRSFESNKNMILKRLTERGYLIRTARGIYQSSDIPAHQSHPHDLAQNE